jgi:hypothetical protein
MSSMPEKGFVSCFSFSSFSLSSVFIKNAFFPAFADALHPASELLYTIPEKCVYPDPLSCPISPLRKKMIRGSREKAAAVHGPGRRKKRRPGNKIPWKKYFSCVTLMDT